MHAIPNPPNAWLDMLCDEKDPLIFGLGPFTEGFTQVLVDNLHQTVKDMDAELPLDDRGIFHLYTHELTVAPGVRVLFIAFGFGSVAPSHGPEVINPVMDILLKELPDSMAEYEKNDPNREARIAYLERHLCPPTSIN